MGRDRSIAHCARPGSHPSSALKPAVRYAGLNISSSARCPTRATAARHPDMHRRAARNACSPRRPGGGARSSRRRACWRPPSAPRRPSALCRPGGCGSARRTISAACRHKSQVLRDISLQHRLQIGGCEVLCGRLSAEHVSRGSLQVCCKWSFIRVLAFRGAACTSASPARRCQ